MNRFQTTFRLLLLIAVLLLATAVTLSATSAPAKHRTTTVVVKSVSAKGAEMTCGATKCADPACPATNAMAAKPAPVTRKAPRAVATSKAAAITPAPVAPGTAGLRIYLDPETGMLGGPNNGAALMSDINPLNESDAGLVQERLPDGSYMVNLQGRFAEYAVVQRDAAGKLVFRCVRSRDELLKPVPVQREDR